MLSLKAWRGKRSARKAPAPAAMVERLEERQLLAYTPLGYSLPDLTIDGFAAPVGAYGGRIAVTVNVRNLGASSLVEPLALEPNAPSRADSPPARVTVYGSNVPNFTRTAVPLKTFAIPGIKQNSVFTTTREFQLPNRPRRGLPADGGVLYLFFRVDSALEVNDFDRTNNLTRHGVPVQLAPDLPDLYGLALNVPPTIQPGDTIAPTIKIVNFGTANPNAQASFRVLLVASDDENFGPGDITLAEWVISQDGPGVPPLALVPMRESVLGDVNINDTRNIVELSGRISTTRLRPKVYNIGVVVDPDDVIQEINEIGRGPDPIISPRKRVGPPIKGLPPAGIERERASRFNRFPTPPYGNLPQPLLAIANRIRTRAAVGSEIVPVATRVASRSRPVQVATDTPRPSVLPGVPKYVAKPAPRRKLGDFLA